MDSIKAEVPVSTNEKRMFTVTVKEPLNQLAPNGSGLAVQFEEAPQFSGRYVSLRLRADATMAEAEQLARDLNRLGVEIKLY